jgi:hypothetical protein
VKRIFAVFFAVALIAGCNVFGTKPSNPQQAVFEVKQSYELALSVAVAYDNLPACTAGVVVCSTQAGKMKVKVAKDAASPAIQAAEDAVRDPSFSASESGAIIATAQAAVVALTAITATLPHK